MKTFMNGLKKAVEFVVNLLLFVPRMIFKGIKHICKVFSAESSESGDFVEDDDDDEEEKTEEELQSAEECNTKVQAEHIENDQNTEEEKSSKVILEDEDAKGVEISEEENSKATSKEEVESTNEEEKYSDSKDETESQIETSTNVSVEAEASALKKSEVKTENSETTSKEEVESTNKEESEKSSDSETAGTKSKPQQATVEANVVTEEIEPEAKPLNHDNVTETIEETDEEETKEFNVEDYINNREVYCYSQLTPEEKAIVFDPMYNLSEHFNESATPQGDKILLDLNNKILSDRNSKANNFDVQTTLKNCAQQLISLTAIRYGFNQFGQYQTPQKEANAALDFLQSRGAVSNEEYMELYRRNNLYPLWTADEIYQHQENMLALINQYFAAVYPKINPFNTAENLYNLRKQREEAAASK